MMAPYTTITLGPFLHNSHTLETIWWQPFNLAAENKVTIEMRVSFNMFIFHCKIQCMHCFLYFFLLSMFFAQRRAHSFAGMHTALCKVPRAIPPFSFPSSCPQKKKRADYTHYKMQCGHIFLCFRFTRWPRSICHNPQVQQQTQSQSWCKLLWVITNCRGRKKKQKCLRL